MDASLKDKLLLEEFKEAWLHYRHIEQMRIAHLGFFFAAFLGGAGAIVTSLAGSQNLKRPQLLATALFLLLLITIGRFILNSIRAVGPSMFHYENVFKSVREIAYGEEFEKYNKRFNVRENEDVKNRSPKHTVQKTQNE